MINTKELPNGKFTIKLNDETFLLCGEVGEYIQKLEQDLTPVQSNCPLCKGDKVGPYVLNDGSSLSMVHIDAEDSSVKVTYTGNGNFFDPVQSNCEGLKQCEQCGSLSIELDFTSVTESSSDYQTGYIECNDCEHEISIVFDPNKEIYNKTDRLKLLWNTREQPVQSNKQALIEWIKNNIHDITLESFNKLVNHINSPCTQEDKVLPVDPPETWLEAMAHNVSDNEFWVAGAKEAYDGLRHQMIIESLLPSKEGE